MTTLTTIMQGTYRKLGQYNVSLLTGGSTTTAIDTKLSGKFKNKEWKDGVMFAERTTDGLAPQGEFQRISDYVNTTQTFTVDTVFTATLASGDVIGFSSSDYPYLMMVDWVNDALRNLGDIILIDSTSLSYTSGTSEYSIPAAWIDVKPFKVEIYQDSDWITVPEGTWYFIPPATFTATASAAGKLVLPEGDYSSGELRVSYRGRHPTVTLYGDLISDSIDPELLILTTAEAALEWYNAANSGGDEYIVSRLNEIRQLKEARKTDYPVARPKKSTKTLPNA